MRGRTLRSGIMLTGLAVLFLVLPLAVNPYYVIVVSHAIAFATACLGVNLLLGTTGMLSLGHAAFFGLGAYAGGFAHTFGGVTSLEIYLLGGVAASTLVAGAAGLVVVRATRMSFSIFTLALAQIVHALFVSGAAFRPFGAVGKGVFLLGAGGLHIPRLAIGGVELASGAFMLAIYYLALAIFGLSAAGLWRLSRSPFGMALRAIRDNEGRAEFIGLSVRAHRWLAFVVSAGITGLAGAVSGQVNRQVTPDHLHWLLSADLVIAVVLGGSRHFWGPVIGAFALVGLREIALRFALHRGLILGSLLVVVILVFPAGIVGGVEHLGRALHALAGRRRQHRPLTAGPG